MKLHLVPFCTFGIILDQLFKNVTVFHLLTSKVSHIAIFLIHIFCLSLKTVQQHLVPFSTLVPF